MSAIAERTLPSACAPNLTQLEAKLTGTTQTAEMRARAAAFAAFLRTRPERVVWVMGHDATLRELVRELFDEPLQSKATNAQVIACAI